MSDASSAVIQPNTIDEKKSCPGLMRALLFVYAMIFILATLAMVFVTKENSLGIGTWVALVEIAIGADIFWLILRRKKHTPLIATILLAITLVVDLGFGLYKGTFTLASFFLNHIFEIIVIAYLNLSKQAKAVLVEPWNMTTYRNEIEESASYFRPRTWPFWRNVIIYLCVFSILGHAMELCMCTLVRYGYVPGTYDPNSMTWTVVLNPFLIYGSAFAMIALVLSPIKVALARALPNHHLLPYLLSFVVNTVVCAGIELVVGLLTNMPVNGVYPYWDYSTMPFNFMGQVCLLYAIFFGVMSSFMCWVVYPLLERQFARVPRDVMNIVFAAVVMFFCLLVAIFNVTSPLEGIMVIG